MSEIPSVKAPAMEGKPFGEKIDEALNYILNLGQSMGFRTKNLDGYAGYIEFGQGEVNQILVHLDVVPEGKDWTYPPFAAEIHDNKIYGRGAIDDKGHCHSSFICDESRKKRSGVPLNKRVRLIIGLDEESGWECINYYKDRGNSKSGL